MAENCNIKLRKHPTKKATALRSHLLLDMKDIMLQDVSDAVMQVADCELYKQEQSGNKATNLFLNNRPATNFQRGRISGAKQYIFRARMLFGSTAQLGSAALEAMQLLRTLTRIKSGAAVRSYHIYLGNTGNTKDPGSFVGTGIGGILAIRDKLSPNSMISIIGPNEIYGRKLYWNPAGSKTVARRLTRVRGLGAKVVLNTAKGGYRGSATIHRDVKKKMSRSVKWKALTITDPFYRMTATEIIGDRRVPAISIMAKAAGRLN